jgi:DNA invertase Pin-like site-specific DNA recombinase
MPKDDYDRKMARLRMKLMGERMRERKWKMAVRTARAAERAAQKIDPIAADPRKLTVTLKRDTETAAIYLRKEPEPDGGFEADLRESRNYCQRRGWTVTGEYLDEWSERREPEFCRLIGDASMHRFDAVVIWRIGRFGLSHSDYLMRLHMLTGYGVRVLIPAAMVDSSDDSPMGRFVTQALCIAAQLEVNTQRQSAAEYERERERIVKGQK